MKTKLSFMKLAALSVSVSLALAAATPALAEGREFANIGKVSIAEKSYFELKNIHLTTSQNSRLAIMNITIHNGGKSALKVIDYWVRLKNKSGSQFVARSLPSDKSKQTVAPGASVSMTFYAQVNESTQLEDLIVEVMKWDLNQPDFQRALGELPIPADYTDVIPYQGDAFLRAGETEIKASIKKLVSNKNEKYYLPTVYWTLENVGEKAVTMPAYTYAIRTSEGLLYPIEAKGIKDTVIKPKEIKDFQLSGSIPVSVSADRWELVVTESIADLNMNLPVGAFQLPAAAAISGTPLGQEYSFSNKSGVYTASMNALYRLPWEDQDLLSADLTLSNKGSDTLAIPSLAGYFLLDNEVKIEAKAVQTVGAVSLPKMSSLNVQMVGKVPFTTKFSQIKLILQEKESDTVTTDVIEFGMLPEMQTIPFHDLKQPYIASGEGNKASYQVRSLQHYASATGSVVVAQVEATNLEKRVAAFPQLSAYFRTADGTVLPATIANVNNKISPNGTALLNVSAALPKGLSPESMQLVLGQAVTQGKLTTGEAKTDSYVNPQAFALPQKSSDVKSSLTKVDLYPYQVTMNRFATSVENSTFTFLFNYEITRDGYVATNVDGHKLVLVFEDGNGNKAFEKSFEMKDIDPVDGESPEAGGTKLKLGKRDKFKIQLTDADLIFKSSFLKKYKLSLYEEFQWQRRLLATQQADWFITTD